VSWAWLVTRMRKGDMHTGRWWGESEW